MEKLRRVLSGNESPDEESGIMSQVKLIYLYSSGQVDLIYDFS